jgi:hypothetical protein
MPCYDPPPSREEVRRWRAEAVIKGDWKTVVALTPQSDVEQWLCDALEGQPAHPECILWHAAHKLTEGRK